MPDTLIALIGASLALAVLLAAGSRLRRRPLRAMLAAGAGLGGLSLLLISLQGFS